MSLSTFINLDTNVISVSKEKLCILFIYAFIIDALFNSHIWLDNKTSTCYILQSLAISEVVGLLGNNLQDLKTFENQTVVRSWISLQLQSELDKLNLGLTGGTADTTTAPSTSTTTKATTVATVKATAGAPGTCLKNTKTWTLHRLSDSVFKRWSLLENSNIFVNVVFIFLGIGASGWTVSFSILVLICTIIRVEII